MRSLIVCGCISVLLPAVKAQQAGEPTVADAVAEGSPEWLIESFFKRKEWPDCRRYYTAEMSRTHGRVPPPGAAYWKPVYTIVPREFHRTEDTRAIAVTITQTETREETNFYVFLQREADGWKIGRARVRVIPPGVIQATAMTLGTREKPSAAEMWDLLRLRSFHLSDTQVKAYFAKNREKLDELAARLARGRGTGVIHGASRPSGIEKETWQQVHDLGLYYVEVQDHGWIDCTLARVGESAVGFLWVHERAERPTPSDKLTVVEHLDGPWYFFRQI